MPSAIIRGNRTATYTYSGQQLLESKPGDQGIPTTCAILSYEVGDANKCAMNVHWGNVRGYHGEASKGIGDAITMLRLLSAQLGLDFWDILRDGEQTYMEAMSIKETRGHDWRGFK